MMSGYQSNLFTLVFCFSHCPWTRQLSNVKSTIECTAFVWVMLILCVRYTLLVTMCTWAVIITSKTKVFEVCWSFCLLAKPCHHSSGHNSGRIILNCVLWTDIGYPKVKFNFGKDRSDNKINIKLLNFNVK